MYKTVKSVTITVICASMWGLTGTSAKDAHSLSNFLLQIFFMLHFKHVWAPYVELGNVLSTGQGYFYLLDSNSFHHFSPFELHNLRAPRRLFMWIVIQHVTGVAWKKSLVDNTCYHYHHRVKKRRIHVTHQLPGQQRQHQRWWIFILFFSKE